ncbi:thioredoxin family protein [Cupriavidus consociatus]|uniref:thioredoxin family protein n=1 Tax=Cupriavidus consociatus TaxID=2821357 RepID=UPI001AE860F6|nr:MULTISPECIES: thioredoxin family protein [unclassified Cupriavidus]MBP0623343.1 thioredoxin family protein [Cupriavidus sp. LEh25]MDK2660041.1 thioredoxin family protein [Cupriavidus sp. LEh21]
MAAKLIALTVDNLPRLVTPSQGALVVMFSASWCLPCRKMTPVFLQLVDALPDLALYGAVDMAVSPTIAQRCGIRAVPSIEVFRKDVLATVIAGQVSLDDLKARVLQAIAN